MTNISFVSDSLELYLDLLEIDPNDPKSLKWRVKAKIFHPTGEFVYSADDIWLDTEMWDVFLKALKNNLQEPAMFCDQSQYFQFSLKRDSNRINTRIQIAEPLPLSGQINHTADFDENVDSPFYRKLNESFGSFAKFW